MLEGFQRSVWAAERRHLIGGDAGSAGNAQYCGYIRIDATSVKRSGNSLALPENLCAEIEANRQARSADSEKSGRTEL